MGFSAGERTAYGSYLHLDFGVPVDPKPLCDPPEGVGDMREGRGCPADLAETRLHVPLSCDLAVALGYLSLAGGNEDLWAGSAATLMHIDGQLRDAVTLLRDGGSDEDVERLTGLDLLSIIEIRAKMAVASLPRVPGSIRQVTEVVARPRQ